MTKVIENGTTVTADRTWKSDMLFHAVVETAEIVA
jgi:hypothetical protein